MAFYSDAEGRKWVRIMVLAAGLVLIIVLGFFVVGSFRENSGITWKESNIARIISVDEVIAHPENSQGYIGVSGKVFQSSDSGISFFLGCEDACMSMPIVYTGTVPQVGTEIIAYGEVKVGQDDRYVFLASQIKDKS